MTNRAGQPNCYKASRTLDGVFGGVPWRTIMSDEDLTSSQKEEHVISAYCQQLWQYILYACYRLV